MNGSNSLSNQALTEKLNQAVGMLISEFVKIAVSDFSSAKNIVKIASRQRKTSLIREKNERKGVHVPPFLIASVTQKCNLNCKGCYDQEKIHDCSPELTTADWRNIFEQARGLGISFILLAGGEPLLKEELIKECLAYPEIIFPVFTNGMLINDQWVEYFAKSRNIVPIVSIEGDRRQTNLRRGSGVYEKAMVSFELLQQKKIFYGISITLTSANFASVLEEKYLKEFLGLGCRLFMFIEYIPFDSATEHLVITEAQQQELDQRLTDLRAKLKALFIAFPGDEEQFGGCLAAGRGFVHLNANGAVEACPFAPYSDVNLKHMTLREALNSPLLSKIRNTHALLDQHKGGCALFENKAVLEKILFEN